MKNVKKHPIFRCPCKFQMTSTSSSLIKCQEKLRTHRHRAHPMMGPRETVEVRAGGGMGRERPGRHVRPERVPRLPTIPLRIRKTAWTWPSPRGRDDGPDACPRSRWTPDDRARTVPPARAAGPSPNTRRAVDATPMRSPRVPSRRSVRTVRSRRGRRRAWRCPPTPPDRIRGGTSRPG